jgi:hypothetical protein
MTYREDSDIKASRSKTPLTTGEATRRREMMSSFSSAAPTWSWVWIHFGLLEMAVPPGRTAARPVFVSDAKGSHFRVGAA